MKYKNQVVCRTRRSVSRGIEIVDKMDVRIIVYFTAFTSGYLITFLLFDFVLRPNNKTTNLMKAFATTMKWMTKKQTRNTLK